MAQAGQPNRAVLRDRIAAAENRPGVYRMLDAEGAVLYVGRSVRVRTRLLSYLRAKRDEKAWEVATAAQDVAWEYVPDEFSAVVREFRLIRRHRPILNVEHKREREICFLKVTREAAPRLLATTRVLEDGAVYYGPFLGLTRLRAAAREIGNLLGLRDCRASTPLRFADQTDLFGGVDHAPLCPQGELRCCAAPCAAWCTERDYLDRLRRAREFFEESGPAGLEPLALLRRRMAAAAERLDFEYAAELRDRARALESLRDSLHRTRALSARLTGVYIPPPLGDDSRAYALRSGRIVGELRGPAAAAPETAMELLRGALARPDPRPSTLDADSLAERLLVLRWFRRRPEECGRLLPAGA